MKNLLIIGTGKLAALCLEIAFKSGELIKLTAIEPELGFFSPVKSVCEKYNIPYIYIPEKNNLTNFLSEIKADTLILSAYNRYIFPKVILHRNNLRIINFHNSLLPKYRGKNAPTWAIYGGEVSTGITWHEIDLEIDSGRKIYQEIIPILPYESALNLTQKSLECGANVIKKNLRDLLIKSYESSDLVFLSEDSVLRSKDAVPNDGLLDLNWPPKKIWNFIRSLDYGGYRVFPIPRVWISNKCFQIVSHKLLKGDETPKCSDSALAIELSHLNKLLELKIIHCEE